MLPADKAFSDALGEFRSSRQPAGGESICSPLSMLILLALFARAADVAALADALQFGEERADYRMRSIGDRN